MRMCSKIVLTIAGSDTSAGAGIQQDLKTITALGQYGATVITAITAQNTLGVQGVLPVTGEMVAKQICSVMDDLDVKAVKIGMIPNLDVAKAIVETLFIFINKENAIAKNREGGKEKEKGRAEARPLCIVWDPVMISTSGTRLMAEDCIEYLQEHLAPLCTLITPNLPESALFLPPYRANMLIKGGHAEGDAMTDTLIMLDGTRYEFTEQRIVTKNLHGTGCTLSSAIASYLAMGMALPEAVEKGKGYLTEAIRLGKNSDIGHGNGPLGIAAVS